MPNDDQCVTLAQWVLRNRTGRGWTQAELSRATDLGCSTISLIERGKRPAADVTALTIGRLEQAFGVRYPVIAPVGAPPSATPTPCDDRFGVVWDMRCTVRLTGPGVYRASVAALPGGRMVEREDDSPFWALLRAVASLTSMTDANTHTPSTGGTRHVVRP